MPIQYSPDDIDSIVSNDKQALLRAIYKWVKFMQMMWTQVTDSKVEQRRKQFEVLAVVFRVTIILLSAAVTTISDINEVPRTVITIVAGVLTGLTGIEAYFRFTEQSSSIQQQQREIQSLRDDLRYRWMIEVELETDNVKRMTAARELLQSGPKAYNNIMNKHVFKSKEDQSPPEFTKGNV